MYIYLNKHTSMATGSVYGLRLPGVKCLFVNGKANKCTNGYFSYRNAVNLGTAFFASRQLFIGLWMYFIEETKKLTESIEELKIACPIYFHPIHLDAWIDIAHWAQLWENKYFRAAL